MATAIAHKKGVFNELHSKRIKINSTTIFHLRNTLPPNHKESRIYINVLDDTVEHFEDFQRVNQ